MVRRSVIGFDIIHTLAQRCLIEFPLVPVQEDEVGSCEELADGLYLTNAPSWRFARLR
jgi:hypothetical protein